MKYLFIGGSSDGRRIEVDGLRPIRIPVPVNLQMGLVSDSDILTETISVKSETYVPRRMCDLDGAEYEIFQYSDDNLCPMARLIQGYAVPAS